MTTPRLLARSLGGTVAVVLALSLSACGSDDDDDDVATPAVTATTDSGTVAPTDAAPTNGDGDDVTDADLRAQLEKIALDEVGEGRVTDVENSDDADHAYEVEVDLGNDDDVSVEIAEDLSVVRVDR